MHLEFLVEEPSVEATLANLVPKILGSEVSFRILTFQGKQNLLARLPGLLKGYAHWMPSDFYIVVLIDEDRQDCWLLKARMEAAAAQAGLATQSTAADDQTIQVLNRIAVEELEAWFLGDIEAIRQVYPNFPTTLDRRTGFRDPDAIQGGTWQALERVLQQSRYFPSGLAKIQFAREVSPHMDPNRNRSHSFQIFRAGLLALQARHDRAGMTGSRM